MTLVAISSTVTTCARKGAAWRTRTTTIVAMTNTANGTTSNRSAFPTAGSSTPKRSWVLRCRRSACTATKSRSVNGTRRCRSASPSAPRNTRTRSSATRTPFASSTRAPTSVVRSVICTLRRPIARPTLCASSSQSRANVRTSANSALPRKKSARPTPDAAGTQFHRRANRHAITQRYFAARTHCAS